MLPLRDIAANRTHSNLQTESFSKSFDWQDNNVLLSLIYIYCRSVVAVLLFWWLQNLKTERGLMSQDTYFNNAYAVPLKCAKEMRRLMALSLVCHLQCCGVASTAKFHHSFSVFRMWTVCRCIWRRFVSLTCSATVKRRVAGSVSCAVTLRKPQVNEICFLLVFYKHTHTINESNLWQYSGFVRSWKTWNKSWNFKTAISRHGKVLE